MSSTDGDLSESQSEDIVNELRQAHSKEEYSRNLIALAYHKSRYRFTLRKHFQGENSNWTAVPETL
jgi:hypothetical protein